MITNLGSLFLIIILISQNDIRQYSYNSEDYVKTILVNNSLSRNLILPYSRESKNCNTSEIRYTSETRNALNDRFLRLNYVHEFMYSFNLKTNFVFINLTSNFKVINLFYVANLMSKPPFRLSSSVVCKPRPYSVSFILILLLLCGDTGAHINPGPRQICNMCDGVIRMKNNAPTCTECKNLFHKKCIAYESNMENFVCSVCINRELPFSVLDDISFLISSPQIDNTNLRSYNIPKPSNLSDDHYECFKRKGLHVIHLNVRSLFNKISELKIIAKKSNAAVICITESWLSDYHTDNSVRIEGYSLLRKDRPSHGGGVCAYIRDGIGYNPRNDLSCENQEDLWFEILLKKSKPLYIGVIYRTDKNKICFNKLEESLSRLRADCDHLILGDFNLCLLKNKIKSKSKLYKQYEEVLKMFNCKQLIREATRETETTSSCLDHIFTNNENKICQSGVIKCGLSDHFITFCTRKIIRGQIGKHNNVKLRSLRNYSVEEFRIRLQEIDWSNVTECDDVNEAWDKFNRLFIDILDSIAPIKEIRIKNRTEPWIDDNILQIIKERDKLLYASNRNKKDKELRKKFNVIRNKLQREVKKAKENYFKNKMEENKDNPKKLWGQLNTIGYSNKTKDRSKIVLESEGVKCHDSKKVCKSFNDYFLNVASILVSKLPSAPNIFTTNTHIFRSFYVNKNITPNNFALQSVTENFVYHELMRLNPNKSTGLDGINARFLRDGANELKYVLTFIINLSISTNNVPIEMKKAKVRPLFKKNDRLQVSNYRPVSILNVVSKLLERAVYTQLEKYLKDNNILFNHQSGFRKAYSTETCLINLTDTIRKELSKGNYVGMVMLDLQKAFDTVDHQILCNKLYFMGVRNIEWFQSYLKHREQMVTVNGIDSDPGIVNCGVPQGSILGPLLFLCYINDMPISIKCKLMLYADDSALMVSGNDPKSISQILSEQLESCSKWLIDNKLSLHLGKTEAILFGSKRKLKLVNNNFQVTCYNVAIKNVTCVKYLGIYLNNCLSGEPIINDIVTKANNRIKFLYKFKDILDKNCRKLLCNALIQCHLDYCCSAWYSGLNKLHQKKLQIVQNKMVRFILNLDYRTHVGQQELNQLNMLKVEDRARQLQLNHLFKIYKGICPEYMLEDFNRISDTALRTCTRASLNNFFLPRACDEAMKSFFYSGIKNWNSLPANIKSIDSESTFKEKVKLFLKKEAEEKERNPFIYYSL